MNKGLWIGLFAALTMAWVSPVAAQSKKERPVAAAKKKPAKKGTTKSKKKRSRKSAKKRADTPTAHGVTRLEKSDDGYSYIFRDDPLAGRNNGAGAARIRVRNHGARQTLLRPRLHFIPELLKSVEDI